MKRAGNSRTNFGALLDFRPFIFRAFLSDSEYQRRRLGLDCGRFTKISAPPPSHCQM